MIERLLRRFGFFKVRYGFACGRHWMLVGDAEIICDYDPGALRIWKAFQAVETARNTRAEQ